MHGSWGGYLPAFWSHASVHPHLFTTECLLYLRDGECATRRGLKSGRAVPQYAPRLARRNGAPWGRHTSKLAPSKPDKRLRLCRAEPRAGASFALWLRATQELVPYWRSMWRPPGQGSRVPERFQPFRDYPAAHAEI